MVKKILGLLAVITVAGFYPLKAQTAKEQWVDSVFSQMSVEQKIGQLFMVSVSPGKTEAELNALENRIKAGIYGGILFMPGNHGKLSQHINNFNSASAIPLLIGMDGSGALEQSDSTFSFPSVPEQGAIANDSLIYEMGISVGRKMNRLGIHLNFIPANLFSSLHPQSFGEDPQRVAAKSLAYWKGLQTEGVLACARSFPIQGLRVTEVQKGVPSVQLTVDSVEAYPFKVLFKNQLPALLPASADLPLFYSKKKTAVRNLFSSSTLSAAFAGDWLRHHMNYTGLIMIDVASMARASDKFSSGDAEVFAFQAGNDILITPNTVSAATRKMKKLLRKQKEYGPQFDHTVKKILSVKYDALTAQKKHEHLPESDPVKTKMLIRKMYRGAITVLANRENILPVHSLEDRKFICLIADDTIRGNIFASRFSKYIRASFISVTEKTGHIDLTDSLRPDQVVVVALFPSTKESTFTKLLPELRENNTRRKLIICDFGATFFRNYAAEFSTVITAYGDEKEMLTGVAEVLFGGIPAEGISPFSYGTIAAGTTNKTPSLDRLIYSFPEAVGMDTETLRKIEAIAKEAIDMKATPGCQVLIAKDGQVVYEKSFGHLTYEKQDIVTNQTIYDLASVTKVTATLQALMFLYDRRLIDMNKKISVYLPELKNSNKKDFIVKDILTHQAGLWPFLPFWAHTVKDSVYLPEYYSSKLSPEYPLVVSDNLFAARTMKDSLWSWIIKARIREKPQRTPFDYRYSDMGFYIGQHLSEKILNQPMEDFLAQNLYEPLGASTTGYLPLLRFPIHQIAPTENDRLFRRSLLIGTVHDQGAAMQGGIAGHAGLFSNANDLAKLAQMLLQEGYYGGTRYYTAETVHFFAQKQFETSRRGLGWDKPTPGDPDGPTSYSASPKTFGHTGFTGTCIWVDPEFNLVYIFLSNRVHPDMTNNKLLSANIRSRIQEVVYQSIFNYCKTAGEEEEPAETATVEAFGKSH
jgi:beta-N-acetylhexosaminidase